jgi:magnesium transporter
MEEESSQKKHATGTTSLSADAVHFIYEALEAGDSPRALNLLKRLYAQDMAELLNQANVEQRKQIVHLLDKNFNPEVLADLEPGVVDEVMAELGMEKTAEAISELDVDDAVYVIENLNEKDQQEVLENISDKEVRADLEEGLSYPEHSAGRLMHNIVVAVPNDWSVGQAIDYMRSAAELPDDFHEIYVTDKEHRPVGGVAVSRLLRTHRNIPIKDIMRKNLRLIAPYMDQEEVAFLFRKYGLVSAPVADESLKLVGVITVDDIVDVLGEEATEDFQKLGGMGAMEQPYMQVPFWQMVQKRAGWLVVLFLGEMLTASAMGFFEHELQKAVILALFIPLIISSGGNSGSQAATLVIRAMALGQLRISDWWKVMRRELATGAVLGGILGSIGFLRIGAWSTFTDVYGPHWLRLGFTVGFTLIGIVLWGTLAGSMLPLLLRRLGLDPATSSAPFIATLVDVTGLILYFSISILFLRGVML